MIDVHSILIKKKFDQVNVLAIGTSTAEGQNRKDKRFLCTESCPWGSPKSQDFSVHCYLEILSSKM